MQDALDYAANRDKTEQSCFESSYACTLETAFADMRQTKERWHKSGGVQGYHLVQSFAAGEVTPELAHRIEKNLQTVCWAGGMNMPLGMLVTLDAIYNRVIQNWKKGRRTWIFCDEFYILFRYEYSANFFYKLWKRIRKYNGLVTGLTQNVDELLRSEFARLMLANSEFLVMLNQSATDRAELAKLLNISDNQLGYVTNVPAGCGLIRCAGNIVPFTNSFPKNTKLYGLMTTKPDEVRKE